MRTYPSMPKAEVSPEGVGVTLEHLPEESGTRAAARAVLDGRKKGLLAILPFLGPAFIACVAYIDPGNFATNIAGGSRLWLQTALGYRFSQPDGDVAANDVGKTWSGNREEPGGIMPARIPQTRRLCHVDRL